MNIYYSIICQIILENYSYVIAINVDFTSNVTTNYFARNTAIDKIFELK